MRLTDVNALELSVAQHLLSQSTEPTAFLINESARQVYFARLDPQPHQPETAVTRLVSGLWRTHGAQTLRIVRRPIYSTATPTELERAFVKVAAKRIRELPLEQLPAHEAMPTARGDTGKPMDPEARPLEFIEIGPLAPPVPPPAQNSPSGPVSDADAMLFALGLANGVSQERIPRARRDRPIGAVLIDAEGRLLQWATNSSGIDRTRHAEANLLQNWWHQQRRPLPHGARLYCTLKPCRMCAALIWTMAPDPRSVKVLYHEHDPGPLAQQTLLERHGMEKHWSLTAGATVRSDNGI